jgi:hypothetical protein
VGIRRLGEAEVAVERLLLLWDELDELMGYGRHLAVGFSFAVAYRGRELRRQLRGLMATPKSGAAEAADPLN